MATIRKRGDGQWHVQIRRRGWPVVTTTKRSKREAEAYVRDIEGEMDRGTFVDRSAAERTTLRDILERYRQEVTDKRPGVASRAAESARIRRFIREEPALCAHAVAHLRPEHFEEYRDRRLTQTVQRGAPNGRGQFRPQKAPPGRWRNDGSLRANAAKPKNALKLPKKIFKGTVKRELTPLKRAIDYSKRRLGLQINPVNSEDVKRPVVCMNGTCASRCLKSTVWFRNATSAGIFGSGLLSISHSKLARDGEVFFGWNGGTSTCQGKVFS
jgi:hypothetical protein